MKKIAIIGAGHRGYFMFATKFHDKFPDKVKIVGVCDPSIQRCQYYKDTIDSDIKTYTDFELMLNETKPDIVLVTTIDGYHHEYIIKALNMGFDVMCEKPITIDEEKGLAIRNAEKKSGKKVLVTFNCRFMPPLIKLKEIIMKGYIGKPLAMNYEYFLNKKHGGDYFKRWHRFMEMCGGMLVHKSTHHFDIANWLIDDDPKFVSAFGNRVYYGLDDREHGERCSTCNYSKNCDSFEDLTKIDVMNKLYFDPEKESGYVRDHCVFKSDTDIYDNLSVSVNYNKGALLTYSLNMFSSYEGYNISITGDKGRLELNETYTAKSNKELFHNIRLTLSNGEEQHFCVPRVSGDHAGADEKLIDMLIQDNPIDPLSQCSDSFDGLKSALIGICANKSIKENKKIDLKKYLDEIR